MNDKKRALAKNFPSPNKISHMKQFELDLKEETKTAFGKKAYSVDK